VFAWKRNIAELIKSMERRGVIWDKNNNLKRVDQDSFIETASYDIKNIEHWLGGGFFSSFWDRIWAE
jgi:hypothetical protein